MVYIKNYIFNHFYLQYLVLLTMVPRKYLKLEKFVPKTGCIRRRVKVDHPLTFTERRKPRGTKTKRNCYIRIHANFYRFNLREENVTKQFGDYS